ncbi:Succinate dehydrogenase, hydrophobic membrane anchor protein [Methylocella tundrae]|uniref:Succinate dehydrogenase hydrophobic membrane anchor subunit n=1 Tax=Methylocella tundrae TaxID=227605 RepID=A0A8B6M5X7_METTU|nr:succinate dehydrogenase, hydrophobic membrane anchor protein [Methylocella tundrae]VTZ50176.1 Succinate dehydrogenase, hydrophobic membrane anchor protein [Methylocella tundrae]
MAHDPAPRRGAAQTRSLGSARAGTTNAWRIHVTSIALIPLTFGFVWILLSLVGKDYAGVRAELGRPFPAIVLLLFILAGVYHMKIGMQSIIDDYIHSTHGKEWALVANSLFCAAVGLASIFAVLKLGLA